MVSTGRKVAIKKIKMGQFKDGLDLTAIREVKYLLELRHPNVIEVKYKKFFLCSKKKEPNQNTLLN
jgi:serine/threonine protein kinase